MVFFTHEAKFETPFFEERLCHGEPFTVPVGDIIEHRFINLGKIPTKEEMQRLREQRSAPTT
jgi:hypothetical protein